MTSAFQNSTATRPEDASTQPSLSLPGFDDVAEAAARLKGHAVETPLIDAPDLARSIGAKRVLLKAEVLQRTGSFKFRGAFNKLSRLPEEARKAGVVAWSSGNHAQGVAAAAQRLGIPATIVMPADAPRIKVENTKSYGAEVVTYDRFTESREEIAAAIGRERGASLVPPYDDPMIVAGQGTTAREAFLQASALGEQPDAFIACCSGGGLVTGCAVALATLSPATKVYSAEPSGLDDMARSLASGSRQKNDPAARSICDALLAPTPGDIPWALARKHLAGGLSVTDDEARAAMAYAFKTLKLVVEPGGAVALAALMTKRLETEGQTLIAVLSGGNADPEVFAEILAKQSD